MSPACRSLRVVFFERDIEGWVLSLSCARRRRPVSAKQEEWARVIFRSSVVFWTYIFNSLVNQFIPRHWGPWWESVWDDIRERQQQRFRGDISIPKITKKTPLYHTNCKVMNNVVFSLINLLPIKIAACVVLKNQKSKCGTIIIFPSAFKQVQTYLVIELCLGFSYT